MTQKHKKRNKTRGRWERDDDSYTAIYKDEDGKVIEGGTEKTLDDIVDKYSTHVQFGPHDTELRRVDVVDGDGEKRDEIDVELLL